MHAQEPGKTQNTKNAVSTGRFIVYINADRHEKVSTNKSVELVDMLAILSGSTPQKQLEYCNLYMFQSPVFRYFILAETLTVTAMDCIQKMDMATIKQTEKPLHAD